MFLSMHGCICLMNDISKNADKNSGQIRIPNRIPEFLEQMAYLDAYVLQDQASPKVCYE